MHMVSRRRVDGFEPDPNFSESTDEDIDDDDAMTNTFSMHPGDTHPLENLLSINAEEQEAPQFRYSFKGKLLEDYKWHILVTKLAKYSDLLW